MYIYIYIYIYYYFFFYFFTLSQKIIKMINTHLIIYTIICKKKEKKKRNVFKIICEVGENTLWQYIYIYIYIYINTV